MTAQEDARLRWGKFWWDDWLNDIDLRPCSPAARALWIDMLCLMSRGDPYGHLTFHGKPMPVKRLGAISGMPERACLAMLDELREAHVFSETIDGIIFSRRMVRDKAASDAGKKNGKGGGNPNLTGGDKATSDAQVKGMRKGDGLTPPVKLEEEREAEVEKKETGANAPAKKAPERGSRLPADWQPSVEDRQYAIARGLDVERTIEDFRGYWCAKAGKDAVMLNWSLTWQRWCRRAADMQGKPKPQQSNWRGDAAESNARRLAELDAELAPDAPEDLFAGTTIEGVSEDV